MERARRCRAGPGGLHERAVLEAVAGFLNLKWGGLGAAALIR
jgi:hypothetical protein